MRWSRWIRKMQCLVLISSSVYREVVGKSCSNKTQGRRDPVRLAKLNEVSAETGWNVPNLFHSVGRHFWFRERIREMRARNIVWKSIVKKLVCIVKMAFLINQTNESIFMSYQDTQSSQAQSTYYYLSTLWFWSKFSKKVYRLEPGFFDLLWHNYSFIWILIITLFLKK